VNLRVFAPAGVLMETAGKTTAEKINQPKRKIEQ
jgi:hypothetical protein